MFCSHCGKEIEEGSRFCSHCGAPVKIVRKEDVQRISAPTAVTGFGKAMTVLFIALALITLCSALGQSGFLDVLFTTAQGMSLALLGLVYCMASRNPDVSDSRSYVLGTLSLSLLVLVLGLVRGSVHVFAAGSLADKLSVNVLFVLAAFAIYLFLLGKEGVKVGSYFQKGHLKEDLQETMDRLGYEVMEIQKEADRRHAQQQSEVHPHVVKQNRSFWGLLVLNLLTGFLYGLFFVHHWAQDINTICAEDGEHTPGALKLTVLSILTIGLYGIFWQYQVGVRLHRYAVRYDVPVHFNPSDILIIDLLGFLIGGFGFVISTYLLIRLSNTVMRDFNENLVLD